MNLSFEWCKCDGYGPICKSCGHESMKASLKCGEMDIFFKKVKKINHYKFEVATMDFMGLKKALKIKNLIQWS